MFGHGSARSGPEEAWQGKAIFMLLMIQSYPGGHDALLRHWKFFLKSGCDEITIITTTDDNDLSKLPANVPIVKLGANKYIDGSHLPQRLIDTLKFGLGNKTRFEHIMVCEYDVLFFHPIRYNAMEHAIASHRAGSKTWGSLANSYWHNPFLFRREAAEKFVEVGQEAINEGICYRNRGESSSPESSPDVFLGYVCEHYGMLVQDNLWVEFSRNSLDIPGDLEKAKDAYLSGVDVIHGVKTKKELEFILS